MKNKMSVMFLVIVLLLCFTACNNEPKKTPAQWCVDEFADTDRICVSAVENIECNPWAVGGLGKNEYAKMYTITVCYADGYVTQKLERRYFVLICYRANKASVSWNNFFGSEMKISKNQIIDLDYEVIEENEF